MKLTEQEIAEICYDIPKRKNTKGRKKPQALRAAKKRAKQLVAKLKSQSY
tara:strand:+ start:2247 stop:2396 length:150 start_codon:yes stop_codon:yes gene_type:complete